MTTESALYPNLRKRLNDRFFCVTTFRRLDIPCTPISGRGEARLDRNRHRGHYCGSGMPEPYQVNDLNALGRADLFASCMPNPRRRN